MQVQTSLENLLQIIGELTVKLNLANRVIEQKTAQCEALIEQDSRRLQEEMVARSKAAIAKEEAQAANVATECSNDGDSQRKHQDRAG